LIPQGGLKVRNTPIHIYKRLRKRAKMGESIRHNRTNEFHAYFQKMVKYSRMNEDTIVTPENVYQEAHKANRELLFEIIRKCHLPGSTVLGVENVLALDDLAKQGKSCLILSEHASNLDVPNLFVRFYDHKEGRLKDIFERFIFIAGTKLNENPMVKLFTEMFTRVVVYAIRSINELKNCEEGKAEMELATKINIRSTRKIGELRNKGFIFFLYAAGTRYRPWIPETKIGITAIHSYLNSFDYFCCVSINGNTMPPNKNEDMTKEEVYDDVMVFNFGQVMDAHQYLKSMAEQVHDHKSEDSENIKQIVADDIMNQIDQLHYSAEKVRNKSL